jgi:alkanesulfonate monooxygenase SsuD/methylene tetrahydromethanopterin reductase-like flavin-dependent oxidoreductase (luciferase family)
MITGEPWPLKPERNQRLAESAEIIKKLLEGEEVTHKGFVTVHEAKLYTRPAEVPPLYCAAISEQTAEWAGSWADGLITVGSDADTAEKVIKAFNNGGGKGKPVFLKLDLSYARTKGEAMDGAYDQWRTNVLPSSLLGDLRKVEHFDSAATFVRAADVEEKVKVVSDIEECKDWLQSFARLKADRLVLHNVNLLQQQFIDDFGAKVLPFV